MSTYHALWERYSQQQNSIALVLALIGLGLALGWLLIARIVPARWQPAVGWIYLASGVAINAVLLLAAGG